MVKLTDNPDASTTARQKGSVSLVWYLPMCVRPAPGPYGARLKLRDPASVRERTHVEYASSSGDANVAEAASDPMAPAFTASMPGASICASAAPSADPAATATASSSSPDASTHGTHGVPSLVTTTETPSWQCEVS